MLSSHNTFWDSLEVADWGEDLARLAKSLLSQMGKDAERALQVLRVRIEKATEQDWKESLASRAGPYTVAFDLLTDSAPELGSQSALRSVLSSNISSMVSSASRAPIAAWFKHLGLMGTRQRRKLIRELLDEICVRSSLSRLFDIVRIGGAEFAEEMKRYSPSDEVVQKIVRPLMKQAKGRTWLRDHRGAVKVVVAAASKPARQAVSKALGQLEADGASDRRSFAESARAEWKL